MSVCIILPSGRECRGQQVRPRAQLGHRAQSGVLGLTGQGRRLEAEAAWSMTRLWTRASGLESDRVDPQS